MLATQPLHYIGQLEKLQDEKQVLRRADWAAIALTDSQLIDPPSRMGMNPADGKPMQLRLPPDERAVAMDDKFIGSFCWSIYESPGPEWDDDLGVVLVSASRDQEPVVRAIAEEFAATMNASFGVDVSLIRMAGRLNVD